MIPSILLNIYSIIDQRQGGAPKSFEVKRCPYSLCLIIASFNVVLYVPCFSVSFCTLSPYVCLDYIYLGLGS